MKTFRWLWEYLKHYKFRYLLGIIGVMAMAGFAMINPILAGRIVDDVIGKGESQLLVPILLAMVGVVIIRGVVCYSYQLNFEKISQDIIMEMRMKTYKKLMSLDFEYYNTTRTGDIMARMTGDTDAVRHFISWVIYNVIANVSTFVFAIVSMASVNVTLTVIMCFVCPFIAFYTVKMRRSISPVFAEVRDAYSKLNSVVQENISGNRIVKAFSSEEYEIEKFEKENLNYRNINIKTTSVTGKYLPRLDLLAGSLSAIMILIGGIFVINGQMSMGDLVVFNGLLWALNNPMRSAGMLINDTERFIISGERICELLDTEPKIKNHQDGIKVERIEGDIVFDHVSFKYEDVDALRDISFEVKSGQTVGIIGQTGAGKSTLVNLICRFYECTSGKVLIDGIDVRRYHLRQLRNQIAIAMQDIFLFSDTIESNIAYGMPNATPEKIRQIAGVAEADSFIRNMPEGYDTIVGERGVGLSGGQKQRISLARAILKDPSILILDDTTSAVDMETELKIQKEVTAISNKRTTFIIAHRISSVQRADMILVMEKGRLIEHGSHDELIAKKGYYYEVYKNQSGNFEGEGGK